METHHKNDGPPVGYWLLGNDQEQLAGDILRLNTTRHPESFNVFDSYAESLLAAGDSVQAVINYRRSLDMNPDNQNAARMLDALE